MVSCLSRACSAFVLLGLAAAGVSPAAEYRPPKKDLGFPVYTNAPLGRQVSGQHAPATTPAIAPEIAQQRFETPEGYEVRLFASEPEVVNPVAMTWDARGRLWVVELYEYPLGAAPGTKPRDRIKILEDVDADGRADKVHVWADGLNLATGILLGDGGAYVGQAPHLLFMRDTDGDDRADHTEIIQTGFGLEDRHELLNGFAWGPDGALYMTHGVFTRSNVKSPNAPEAEPVVLTAGLARLKFDAPGRAGAFEVFAEGTSNPWGVDFNATGDAFVSACVIEHLFHLAPGGIYDRQAGSEPHPFAYQRLKAINDHRHHMAAYAGIQVYQGDQFPEENLGSILQGNIHDNAVHQDRLIPNGSSFTATRWRDLVRAHDGWFMPVSTQIGPDGAVWIMDWYDRYPCYQNANADPHGVDREHGRIWRVVYTGGEKGKPVPSRPSRDMNLAALGTGELVELLRHPNVWHRRMAQRLLTERRPAEAREPLERLFRGTSGREGKPGLDARLAAFWTLRSSGLLSMSQLLAATRDEAPAIRTWAARFIGERGEGTPDEMEALERLATDPSPAVRLAVAVACRQFHSSQLTVNRKPARDINALPILAELVRGSARESDPVIPFMIWHAAEPAAAKEPADVLDWLVESGSDYMPLAGELTSKLMRRICDMGDAEAMNLAARFLQSGLAANRTKLLEAALEGLIEGQQGRVQKPTQSTKNVIRQLAFETTGRLRDLGRRLGALWGDDEALGAVLSVATDANASVDERLRAIEIARYDRGAETRKALLSLLQSRHPERVQMAAVESLGALGGSETGGEILDRWTDLAPRARSAAAATLAARREWAFALLDRVAGGSISASEFGAPVIRNLLGNRDQGVRERAREAIGRFRESPEDKGRLVAEKRAAVLKGTPDLNAGREAARQLCLVCHKFYGEGAEVGPDLTGVGRSSLDALLWNIIDPNQVIGAGYEQVEIETRDGRIIAGRLVEDSDARVRLLMQGPVEHVIAKQDIESRRVLESSVMPEGLEQMDDATFRDLVWYILAPPEEQPLSAEKRRILIGEARE